MLLKILMLVVFFGSMVAIGLYCRKHATNVDGFVLGGRSVGPRLTAFAYGTTNLSAVVFVGRHRERPDRIPSGMDHPGPAHPHHDPAPVQRHDA